MPVFFTIFVYVLLVVIIIRNRLMIPICDPDGAVIGFGARLLPTSEQKSPAANGTSAQSSMASAKYVNSPETVLFKKVRQFY